ncbi:hypothetical protein AGMMS4956_08780 [Bacteroidia bacterium]|nr:hypothetical protein AGMMS4956_08780 [Bacteroidia bacterium]
MEQLVKTKKYARQSPQFNTGFEKNSATSIILEGLNGYMHREFDSRLWNNRVNFTDSDELSMKEITEIVDEVRQEMYDHAEQYL